LPRIEEPAALAGGPDQLQDRERRPLRVLIIEDNVDSAQSLQMALQLVGCDVAVAYSGPDGVDEARRFRPALVICDIGLPGFSGYEVARRIRAEANGTVVLVALTGYGSEADREAARLAGFNRHFTKPVDIEQLEAAISAIV
jgi:DNA-binding response OmpR family regulator